MPRWFASKKLQLSTPGGVANASVIIADFAPNPSWRNGRTPGAQTPW